MARAEPDSDAALLIRLAKVAGVDMGARFAPESMTMIVSAGQSGLGNRIKSWVSAMRLGPDVRVNWATGPRMPARFSDLFAGNWEIENIPTVATVYMSWRLAVLPEDEPHLPAGFATATAGAHPLVRGLAKAWWNLRGQPSDRYRFMVFPKTFSRRDTRDDARHIDLEYARIPRHFRDVYVPLFRRIAVRPDIAERVSAWADVQLDPDVIGVQVRTWRDSGHRHRRYHKPGWQRLLRLIESTGATQRYFVASDHDEIVAALRERCGADRILLFPRRTMRQESWKTAEGMREDLIEMLLLARAERLFLSYLSTFGEAAWWFGGATADVSVF